MNSGWQSIYKIVRMNYPSFGWGENLTNLIQGGRTDYWRIFHIDDSEHKGQPANDRFYAFERSAKTAASRLYKKQYPLEAVLLDE